MTNELTREDYLETMRSKMLDVSDIAEPVVDIWPYVSDLAKDKILSNIAFDENLVEKVYRNIDYSYEHVLIPTGAENIFIVLVIDRVNQCIYGHYKLALTDEYDL